MLPRIMLCVLLLRTTFVWAAAAAPATAPVPADVVAMVNAIETSMTKGDGSELDKYFDAAGFAGTVTKGLDPAFRAEIIRELQKNMKLGKEFKASMGDSGSYHVLRLRDVNGSPRALFRLIGANGLNYHDLVIVRDSENKPRVSDLYVFAGGEMISETVGRTMRQMGAAQQPGKPMDEFTRGIMRLGEMRQLVNQQKGAEALKIYDSLPPKVQADKVIQTARLAAAAQTDDATYQAALDDFQKRFAGEASADLLAIDQTFMRKQYDAMAAAIDRLDKKVGGDPYLNVLRGNGRLMQNDLAGAKQFGQKAVAAEPGLYDGYDQLLTISLKEKNHADTARLLAVFEDRFGMKFEKIASAPLFAEFVQSPEYQTWLKRPKKATQ